MSTSTRRQTPALVAALVGLVVIGAALAGPWHVTSHPFGGFFSGTLDIPTPPVQDQPLTPPPIEPGGQAEDPFVSAYIAIGVLVGGVLLALLVRYVVRVVREHRPQPVQDEALAGTETDSELVASLPGLTQGVNRAQAALAGDLPPTDAVVAAWIALERGAASTGVARNPAQTPTEFTVAVLDGTRADPAATRALLDLYLRARFSEHPLTEADVAAARAHLRTLSEGVAHRRRTEGGA